MSGSEEGAAPPEVASQPGASGEEELPPQGGSENVAGGEAVAGDGREAQEEEGERGGSEVALPAEGEGDSGEAGGASEEGQGVEEGAMDVGGGGDENGSREEGEMEGKEKGDGQSGEQGEVFDPDAEEGEIIAEQIQTVPHEPGTEIFVGGLQRSVTEDDLRKLFSTYGDIVEVRVMIDRKTNTPKGFAFVRFSSKESAQKALEVKSRHMLNGKTIEVGPTEDNRRLAIFNLDLAWTVEECKTLLQLAFKAVKGIAEMDIKEDTSGAYKNLGTGIVLFESHEAAKEAISTLTNTVMVAGRPVRLEWAKVERTTNANDKRTIYIANLPADVKREELEEIFKKYGTITKLWIAVLDSRTPIKGRSDFGFVAYDNDASFNEALEKEKNATIRGQRLDVRKARQNTRSGRDGRPGDGRPGDRRGPGGRMGPPGGGPPSRLPPPPSYDAQGPVGAAGARGVGSLAVDPGAASRDMGGGDYRSGDSYRGRGPAPSGPRGGYYGQGQQAPPPPYDDRKRRGRSAEWDGDPHAKRGRMAGPPPPLDRPYGGDGRDSRGPPRDDWEMRGGGGRTGASYGPGGYRDGPPRDQYRRGPRDDGAPYRREGDDRYRRPGDARDYRGNGASRGGPPPYDRAEPPVGGGYGDRGGRDAYPPREPHGRVDYGQQHPRSPYGRDQRERAPSPYGPAGQAPSPVHGAYAPPSSSAYSAPGYDQRGPPAPYTDYGASRQAPPPQQPYQYGAAPAEPVPQHAPPAPYAQPPPTQPAQTFQPPTAYPPASGVMTGPRGPVSAGPSSMAAAVPPKQGPKLMPPGAKMLMPPGAKSAMAGAKPPAPGAPPGANGYQQPPPQQGYYQQPGPVAGHGPPRGGAQYPSYQQPPPQQHGYQDWNGRGGAGRR